MESRINFLSASLLMVVNSFTAHVTELRACCPPGAGHHSHLHAPKGLALSAKREELNRWQLLLCFLITDFVLTDFLPRFFLKGKFLFLLNILNIVT